MLRSGGGDVCRIPKSSGVLVVCALVLRVEKTKFSFLFFFFFRSAGGEDVKDLATLRRISLFGAQIATTRQFCTTLGSCQKRKGKERFQSPELNVMYGS